jgi:Peptidase C13 family
MRKRLRSWLALAGLLVFAGSAIISAPQASAVPQRDPEQGGSLPMRAVLVAGDGSLRVFDNGVTGMAAWLHDSVGIAPDQITRLSASPAVVARQRIEPASWRHVIRAIEGLNPAPGQACFVFVTSHGISGEGVELSYDDSVLRPAALDRALTVGCGSAPTVAIISACYSGTFAAPPMTRANRIILTAARSDRPSFGCGADETYTFFDQCLLSTLHGGLLWRDVFAATRSCIEQREARDKFTPSMPQGWFGAAVADLPLPMAAY